MAILESKDPDGAKKGQYSGPRNRRASQMLSPQCLTTKHVTFLPSARSHFACWSWYLYLSNLQDQCARYDVVCGGIVVCNRNR